MISQGALGDSSGVCRVGHFRYNGIMNRLDSVKINRKALSVASLLEPSDEKAYWLSKPPHERLQAAELMRQIVYFL